MKQSVFFTLVSGLWILGSQISHAILDTNNNGFSDFWEREHNAGELFVGNLDPLVDSDSDGWTNAQEAAAGTSPFDANPPDGLIRPVTAHAPAVWSEPDEFNESYLISPEAVTVSWPTLGGKKYTLWFSPDLTQESWLPVGDPFTAYGGEVTYGFETSQADKCFWRVSVEDIDDDNDGLTNHEEFLAGTAPSISDTDGDTLSDHAEFIAATDPLQADADGDGWTDPQEIAAGTDSRNQDTDGDGIPDPIDSQPLVSNFAFPDADADGISDGDDTDPTNPRGPVPLITSETTSGNPFSNLIKDETARFVFTVSNPDGPAPTASNLTFFLNGTQEAATITAIGSAVTSVQRFLLTWSAKTSSSYPTRILQNLTLRFRDAQHATTWFNLARIDIAEWEGYIAMVPVPQTETDGNNTSLEIESHINGKRYSDSFGGSRNPREVYYRGPRSIGMRDEDSHDTLTTFQIPAGIKSPLFFTRFLPTGISNTSTVDAGDFSNFPHNSAWYFNYSAYTLRYDWNGIVTEVAPYSTAFQEYGTAWGNSSIAVDWLTNPEFALSRSTWHHEWPFRGTFDRQIYPAYPITTTQPTGSVRTFGSRLFSKLPASITPHLAGTFEVPGLLVHPFSIEKAGSLFLVPSETYHKILYKVDPAAEEWTAGIRLHLGQKNTGYNGENMPPQQGISLYQVQSNSPVPVALDADGNILLTPTQNATLYQKLTSSEGLPLFLKRTSAADQSHTLKIQVLSKFEADMVTTVAETDLVPVDIEQQDYNPTNGIRFCRWLDSFPSGNFRADCADTDRDRFRIRTPMILPKPTKIRIKSEKLDGAVIDGALVAKTTDGDYDLDMKEANGAMVSEWILLVSDGDDDKKYNGRGTDDAAHDQTLLAAFDSKIIVSFPELGNAQVEIRAQKPIGKVTLNIQYMSPAGNLPPDRLALMLLHVSKMKEIYRQIGIQVNLAAASGATIPQDWLAPGADPSTHPADYLNGGECRLLNVQIRERPVPAKQIRIGYVDAELNPLDSSFNRARGWTYQSEDGITVSLSSLNFNVLGVTAHEVGHTFGLLHSTPKHHLMYESMDNWSNNERDPKRFEGDDLDAIKANEYFYETIQ